MSSEPDIRGEIPGLDEVQVEAMLRTAFAITKRAWSELSPAICRHVMTEELWQQQKASMEAVRLDGCKDVVGGLIISELEISGQASQGTDDEVTARLTIAGTEYIARQATNEVVTGSTHPDQWVEDWAMQRSRDPQLLAEAANPKCPNCGAPLNINPDGLCSFCNAAVPGAKSDWLASSIDRPPMPDTTGQPAAAPAAMFDPDTARAALVGGYAAPAALADPGASAGLAAIAAHDPDFSVGDLVSQARELFFRLDQAHTEIDPRPVRAYISDELWQSEVARAQAAAAAGRNQVRAFLDIGTVQVARANSDANGDSVSIEVQAQSADHLIDVHSGKLVSGGDDLRAWSENLIFVRGPGIRSNPLSGFQVGECPNCGAAAEADDAGCCNSCGKHVTGGEFDWTLWQIEGPRPVAAGSPAG